MTVKRKAVCGEELELVGTSKRIIFHGLVNVLFPFEEMLTVFVCSLPLPVILYPTE